MALCDKLLTGNLESICGFKKGVQRTGKIFNRADIEGVGVLPDDNVIDEIDATSFDVVVPGNNPFEGLSQNLEVGTYANLFTTDIPIVILNNNPNVSKLIEQLVGGEFVLVLENNNETVTQTQEGATIKGGKYQVYGWEVGLTVTAATREPYGDNPGWLVTLHEEGASEAALFFGGSL